jgi:hypothetical protein
MKLGKVHLLSETRVYAFGNTYLRLWCGKETRPGHLVEYTNSVPVMESLPTTMTCKACLRAMKGKV